MALESGTYISDLVATNPVHTDGLNNADGHLRLLKTTVHNTFPNITGAVTPTQAQINVLGSATAATMLAVQGILEVPQQSATVGGEVILSPPNDSGGDVILLNSAAAGANGALRVTINNSANAVPANVLTSDYAGNVAALLSLDAPTIKQGGNALLPSGVILLWSGSVVSIPTGYYLCNGSNGTPDLRGQFIVGAGGAYSPTNTGGGGAVTSSSDGSHSHGAATASGGSQAMTGSADSQGAHTHGASTGSYGLTISDIPPHTHGVQMSDTGVLGSNGLPQSDTLGVDGGLMFTNSQGGGNGHAHSISSDGAHTHNITVSSVNAHQHSISSDGAHTHTVAAALPPYYSLAYIMKG